MVQVNKTWYDITTEYLDCDRCVITITREGEYKRVSFSELFVIVANADELNIDFETEGFGEREWVGNSAAVYHVEGYTDGGKFYTDLWEIQADYLSQFGIVSIPAYICIS